MRYFFSNCTVVMKKILWIGWVLAVSACVFRGDQTKTDRVRKIFEFGERYGFSIEGDPVSDEVRRVENLHVRGQIDELHTRRYKECLVSYYLVVPEKRRILSRLELTSKMVELPFGIRVGVPEAEVSRVLGKPRRVENGTWLYECGEGYSLIVGFKIMGGRVCSIIWEGEID